MSSQAALKKRLQKLMNKPENQRCCDCPEKSPRWASLIKVDGVGQMGAFMCLECSGSHRRLGVHITFVRSVNLDSWKDAEVEAMERGGNGKINALYEANLPNCNVKIASGASGTVRERYIRDKYERRRYFDLKGLEKLQASLVDDNESSASEESSAKNRRKKPSAAATTRSNGRKGPVLTPKQEVAPTPTVVAVPPHPTKMNEPEIDLLDFASFDTPVVAAPTPSQVPPSTQATVPTTSKQSTIEPQLDLFDGMNMSNVASIEQVNQSSTASVTVNGHDVSVKTEQTVEVSSARKTNDEIMSMFNKPYASVSGNNSSSSNGTTFNYASASQQNQVNYNISNSQMNFVGNENGNSNGLSQAAMQQAMMRMMSTNPMVMMNAMNQQMQNMSMNGGNNGQIGMMPQMTMPQQGSAMNSQQWMGQHVAMMNNLQSQNNQYMGMAQNKTAVHASQQRPDKEDKNDPFSGLSGFG